MLSVVVIEDDSNYSNALKALLLKYSHDSGEEIKVSVFGNAEDFLNNYKPLYDIIFMDIRLPGMDGMEAAEELRQIDTETAIIFITDMKQFAVRGYKVNALDFFVKPVSYFDLKLRLDRYRMIKKTLLPPIVIHLSGIGDKIMSSDNLYYIEIMNQDLTYHTANGIFTSRSVGLKALEADLHQRGFARCSASCLVNLRWCEEINKDSVNVNGKTIKISRGLKRDFITRLSNYFTGFSFNRGENDEH